MNASTKEDDGMLYELRVYDCVPGKLPALLQRFETKTIKLWERHGIRPAGFWTTVIGESNQQLIYMLAWESLAERERKWSVFMSDPEWLEARAMSEKDGPIIARISSQILEPTTFSSVK
jgi:NIPSNAP